MLRPIDSKPHHPWETELSSASKELKRCKAVSARCKLPVEIWKTVFVFACSQEKGYSLTIEKFGALTTLVKIPITLSHVCSRWRTIVIGSPRLWSSISITFNWTPLPAESLLDTFLTNSADHPLDIRVIIGAEAWNESEQPSEQSEHNVAILRSLSSHFSRCNRLFIEIDDYDSPFYGFQGLDLAFHNISSLRLNYPCAINSLFELKGDNPFWQALLDSTSKLTEVAVDDLTWYPPDFLPYLQITTLFIERIRFDNVPGDLLRALGAFKNLRSLTLRHFAKASYSVDRVAGAEMPPSQAAMPSFSLQTVMPSLQTLVIRNNCQTEMTYGVLCVFFSSLVVPKLSSFELQSSSPHSSHQKPWPPSLLTMLQNASTTLRHVSLTLTSIHFPAVWEPLSLILRTTPHLTHLDLGGGQPVMYNDREENQSFRSDTFIVSSVADLTDTSLLPRLECLSLHHIQLNSEFMGQIVALAESRSPSRFSAVQGIQYPLMKLRILCYEERQKFVLEPHMLEAIRKLKAEGVNVTFERTNAYCESSPLPWPDSRFDPW
ncbi:hypothetical protein E1B28_003608 [Marasmius oreades]|uniref:F-box domain-containing protein n=1 Tax=Marasmius oreades TaxID=181124 RepID=A0A9P7RMW0_9AGAR|nr:uncharacterized protein E1B28_003608 [Marasmius oreades]KAG7086093.1 hypothetical protein E1B28_003608 [Marasmius oreades]